jgi:hypothetical protein
MPRGHCSFLAGWTPKVADTQSHYSTCSSLPADDWLYAEGSVADWWRGWRGLGPPLRAARRSFLSGRLTGWTQRFL